MSFEDISVKFSGLAPAEFTKTYVQTILREIYEESPYGSTLYASFSKHDGAIKGVVRINSSAGPFFAVASDENLAEVTRKLTEQLRRRLRKWKSKRFKHESIKNIYDKNQDRQNLTS